MLNVQLDEVEGIAILEPDGELTEADFASAAGIIDPYIEKVGQLNGVLIQVESFPGWDSFAALLSHLTFIREHHTKVSRIAFATGSPVGILAEKFAGHFVNAEIRNFAFDESRSARNWILGAND